MTNYVAGFMRDDEGGVALVRKVKPKWQSGKLNGIGGKIEGTETPLQAMCREWREETGNSHADWKRFCILTCGDNTVHFFKATVNDLPVLNSVNDIGEDVNWYREPLEENTITNLRWLIPLAFEDNAETVVMAVEQGALADNAPGVAVAA